MSRLHMCDKLVVSVRGQANLYCMKPLGHDGDCEIMEVCEACRGSGRTGRVAAVRIKPAAIIPPVVETMVTK